LLLARISNRRRKTPRNAPPTGNTGESLPESERDTASRQFEHAPIPTQNAMMAGESCASTVDLGKMGMVHISGRLLVLPGAALKN